MNRQQKIAWSTLAFVGLALGLSLLTFGVLYLGLGWLFLFLSHHVESRSRPDTPAVSAAND